MTLTAAAMRGMIKGANMHFKAFSFENSQSHHNTCQKNAETSNIQIFPTRTMFTVAALRGIIECANKHQKAY